MVNDIMRDYLHQFVIFYLDDVYVYIRTLNEHLEHMRLVLQHFKEEGLKLRLKSASTVFNRWSTWATLSASKIPVSRKKV
jgi:hypothetical protein